MKNAKLSLVYGIGAQAKSKEYSLYEKNLWDPLKKQEHLSFPVITSITVRATIPKYKKNDLFSIYVGKELNLRHFNDYYLQKYDLDEEELMDFKNQGYERVCLLNYKKYDLVMIGLKKFDKVVPDYYALKRDVTKLEKLMQRGLYQ